MKHSVLCFLCRQNEAEPGDLCEGCNYRIDRMETQIEMEFEPAPSPMRQFVNSVLAPMFGAYV